MYILMWVIKLLLAALNMKFMISVRNKFRIVFAIIIALFLAGCGKSKDVGGDEYYFTFKIDGQQMNFSDLTSFQMGEKDGKVPLIVVIGVKEPGPLQEQFGWSLVRDGADFKPGTYTMASTDRALDAQYAIKKYTEIYESDNTNDFKVTIESYDKTDGIRGTFSGTLRTEDGKTVKVTEGKFHAHYSTA